MVSFLFVDASYDKEQDWKFRYVYKGPNRTRQKQLFFVYGKGLKSSCEQRSSSCSEQEQYTESHQLEGHLYYNMVLIPKGQFICHSVRVSAPFLSPYAEQ